MSEVLNHQSTWASKLKAMGPGNPNGFCCRWEVLTLYPPQAGGFRMVGPLLLLVILANVFKYPFFRLVAECTADTGKQWKAMLKKEKLYL